MFSPKEYRLSKERLKGWKNVNHLLRVHEDSQGHNTHMATRKELEVRFAKGLTTVKREMALAEAERLCNALFMLFVCFFLSLGAFFSFYFV